VLEAIYSVAGIPAPKEDDDSQFGGHPLAVRPKGAGAVFFGAWPALVLLSALVIRLRFT